MDGSSRRLNNASMPADRAQASQGVGKVPRPIPASLRDTPARKPGKALSKLASRQNGVRDQASHSRKPETARPHSVCTLMSQSPKTRQGGVSMSSKVQLPSCSLTMEVEAVTYALRWIASRGDSQTTHATILTESKRLLQKIKSGMGSLDWKVLMVGSTFENSCGCTALDMPE